MPREPSNLRHERKPAVLVMSIALTAALASRAQGGESLRVALSASGLSETAMAAACVDVPGVHVAFETIRGSLELNGLLDARDSVLRAEQTLCDVKAMQDPLDPDGATAIATAQASLAAAICAMESAAEALADAFVSLLPEQQRSRLRAWRASPAGLPPEMRVRAWTESESQVVLAALLDERLAQSQGASMNESSAALLASIRASGEVSGARACLSDASGAIAAFRAELAAP